MEIKPTHSLRFVDINDDENMLPEVRFPITSYTVGDVIQFHDVYSDDGPKMLGKYKVTDIEHNLFYAFDGDQEIVIYLEKMKDD